MERSKEPTLDDWAELMQGVTSTYVTSNGGASTYATLNEPTMDCWADLMQGFTPTCVTSKGAAPTSAPPNNLMQVSRAVQLSADAHAVRVFLLSHTRIDGDLIEEIIQKGGVSDLAALKHLREEDFTDPVRSIISPKVIPVPQARLLIKESIPKLFLPPTHVRIDVLSSPVDVIPDRHALVNADHVIPHGPSPLSHDHGTDPSGVSPTMSRGGLQALSPTRLPEQQQQQRLTPVGTCSNCARQDASVELRCVSPTQPLWLCRACSNLVEMGRSMRNTSSSGSDESQGGSVSTRSSRASWVSALDSEGRPDGFQAPPPSLRSADLDLSQSETRGKITLLAAIQKQAPVLPVDN